MPAPRKEPHTKVCLSLPDALIERLQEYPGEQSWKIQMLVEYALEMGAMMTIEDARQIAGAKLFEAIKSSRKVPSLFEKYLKK